MLTAQGRAAVYKIVRTDDEDWPFDVYECKDTSDALTASMKILRVATNMTETQAKLHAVPGKELVAHFNLRPSGGRVGEQDPRVAQVGKGADLGLVLSILSVVQSWLK